MANKRDKESIDRNGHLSLNTVKEYACMEQGGFDEYIYEETF